MAGKVKNKGIEGWVEIHQGRNYTPTEYDIGYQLKLEVSVVDMRTSTVVEPSQSIVASKVEPLPQVPERRLISLLPNTFNLEDVPDSFTIMTYNILAPYLVSGSEQPSNLPAYSLDFEYRKRLIMRELEAYNADILCLQEVQSDHWANFWKEALDALGYDGQYKQKSGDGIYVQQGHVHDGCAILYKKSKYKLVKSYPVEYDLAADSVAQQYPDRRSKVIQRLAKNNVALFAVLERIDRQSTSKSILCVANTHIFANPDAPDVKVWQTSTLLSGVERIATSTRIPIVVAGDFNSVPSSAPYKLITQGRIAPNDPVHKQDPLGILKTQKISHQLQLASVWNSLKSTPTTGEFDQGLWKLRTKMDRQYGEPTFTLLAHDFTGALDYIFYDIKLLQPIALMEMPAKTDCAYGSVSYMPNPQWPSDHLAVMAAFRQAPPEQRNGTHVQPYQQNAHGRYNHR